MKNTARLGARRVLLRSVAAHTVSLAPLHEPERRPPARREPAAWSNDRAGPEAGAPIPRFMVPMHAQKQKEAFHEPQSRAGVSPATVGNADGTEPLALARSLGGRDACPTLGALRFMVPVHAQKRKEPLHEPCAKAGASSRTPSALA